MKQMFTVLLLACFAGLALASAGSTVGDATFRFANYYGDHMVLQQAPASATVWGYVLLCGAVTVTADGKSYMATIIPGLTNMCKWSVRLGPMAGGSTPHVITATSAAHGSIKLSDVLFGDVWMCGGQSNMQFSVPQVFNAAAEIAAAANYPEIRLFTAALKASATPVDELLQVEQPWAVASPESVNGSSFTYFSATCWFFGKNLYDHLKYPIGLVDSDWGGTPVEAWSSHDALTKCNKGSATYLLVHPTKAREDPNPHTPSVLWNAMIHPFLNMSIKGAIWYQGEANAGSPYSYNCTFPAMIDDWRAKWSAASDTYVEFPFGFVQLAPTGNTNHTVDGFPIIRWAQTANYGYVPNARMKRVFMAVAIDLGDPTSPYGSIHPRDKQDVGARLALAGRAVAYADTSVYYTGPLATAAKMAPSPQEGLTQVAVQYSSVGMGGVGLELRFPYGFELGCDSGTWIEGTAVKVEGAQVIVEFPSCPSGAKAVSVRYCWRTDPCTAMKCPVYSDNLPSPPFTMDLM